MVACRSNLLGGVPDIVRRHKLPFLDVDDAPGAARCDEQIRLPAEERRDLQNIGNFGRGRGLRGFVDVGEDTVPCGFQARKYSESLFEARAAKSREAGAIGLVEGSLKDKRPGDLADGLRHEMHVLFRFDHARPGNQGNRRATSEQEAFPPRAGQLYRLWIGHQDQSRREYSRTCSNAPPRRAERRLCRCSWDAPMKDRNSGCGSMGFDLNSGWNWQPRYHGWSAISQISTYV